MKRQAQYVLVTKCVHSNRLLLIFFNRLLLMWIGDIKTHGRKWNKQEVIETSRFLIQCNETRPTDIHRSIRAMECIKYWKATEFRTFLLYIGVVLLKGRISEEEYTLFLKLFCAVTICSSHVYAPCLPLARQLFIDFIENHIEIYGESSITINIHNTNHVVDDVEMFGPLNTIAHMNLKTIYINKLLSASSNLLFPKNLRFQIKTKIYP